MRVEVVYALPDEQKVISLEVPEGTTVQAAIELSGILSLYSEIDLTQQPVGIFSQVTDLETSLKEADRVEIYRKLLLDPMEARRRRAKKQRSRASSKHSDRQKT